MNTFISKNDTNKEISLNTRQTKQIQWGIQQT